MKDSKKNSFVKRLLHTIGGFAGVLPIKYKKDEKVRTGKEEFLKIAKDILTAFGMALIFIQFIIQAFKIPTGSMEDSLLVGDFLLGLKYIYGSPVPFTYKKLPGLREPEKNDVVIFKYPGDPNYPNNDEENHIKLLNTFIFGILFWDKEHGKIVVHRPKDFIKRCVATYGDSIYVKDKVLFVNSKEIAMAKRGKHVDNRVIPYDYDPRDNFGPYRVPSKGDNFFVDSLNIREFFWVRSIIYQENPTTSMKTKIKIFLDDSLYNVIYQKGALYQKYSAWDWHAFESNLKNLQKSAPDKKIVMKYELSLNGERINEYTLKFNTYFMMGDNRDNSLDSRYWGFVSKRFVNAKAFITYFSWDSFKPFLTAIRFSRVGKLIF